MIEIKIKFLCITVLIICIFTAGCSNGAQDNEISGKSFYHTSETTNSEEGEETITHLLNENSNSEEKNKIKIRIGDTTLTATLEDNRSADAFYKMIEKGSVTIEFSQYGGFEQVGDLGTELPSDDVQTTTSQGDIVLYASNRLVMFYGSNSWDYTRLGKIDDVSDLNLGRILGGDSITAVFTLV